MANRTRGDERRGEDGDEGQGNNVRVVQIENSYFERLRERMGQQQPAVSGTGIPASGEPEEKPAEPSSLCSGRSAPVIYNDDGSIYKRPDG